jgi:hypothetical protein
LIGGTATTAAFRTTVKEPAGATEPPEGSEETKNEMGEATKVEIGADLTFMRMASLFAKSIRTPSLV